jgi:putative transposase
MHNIQDLNRGRHVVYSLHAHLVFVTKYRRPAFSAEHMAFLKGTFEVVCEKAQAQLIEFNGEEDHVHLLVSYSPKTSLAVLTNSLKGRAVVS